MKTPSIERDERTVAVENESYRWAYLILSYGLLVIVAVRAYAFDQASWDLLALVVVAGGVASAYQGFQNILTSRWALVTGISMAAAGILAVLFALLR
ncbi:MAG: hypothetical protein R2834_23230 [Rhodothermales bacterium]